MTAAARSQPASPPDSHLPDLRARTDDEFVPVSRWSQVIGKNEGHLRRVCGKELAADGRARQIRNPDSGQLTWHVHRSIDRRLCAGLNAGDGSEQAAAHHVDLSVYTQQQRDVATAKANILRDYRRMLSDPNVTMKTAVPPYVRKCQSQISRQGTRFGVSKRSLERWHAEAPPTDRWLDLVEFFIDQRGGDRVSADADVRKRGRMDELAWEHFQGMYLRFNRLKMRYCWRMTKDLAAKNGWNWIGYSRCKQLVRERINAEVACYHRHGETEWSRKFEPTLQQDPEAWAVDQLWISDHTQLDFFIQARVRGRLTAVRPWLTAWQDWRTRLIVGWCIELTPSSDTIRLALHRAIVEHERMPKHVWIDHGKDYESEVNIGLTKQRKRKIIAEGEDWREQLEGAFGMLGLEVHFSLEYNPNGKARMERRFRPVHEHFDRTFDSWCGSKPGEVEVPKWVSKQPERLPTIEQIRERFVEYLEVSSHDADHAMDDLRDPESGRRLSPAEAYQDWCQLKHVLPDQKILDILLMKRWSRPLKVSPKNGIGITIPGSGRKVHYGQQCLELAPFRGSKTLEVRVAYDPKDMSRISVWTKDYRFLCHAPMNPQYGGVGPASRELLAEGMKLKKQQRQAVRDAASLAFVPYMDPVAAGLEARKRDAAKERERLARKRARDGKGDDTMSLPSRLVQTPIDDALPAIQRAELKQAAGGETTGTHGHSDDSDIDVFGVEIDDDDNRRSDGDDFNADSYSFRSATEESEDTRDYDGTDASEFDISEPGVSDDTCDDFEGGHVLDLVGADDDDHERHMR